MSDGSIRHRPFISITTDEGERTFVADFTVGTEDEAREFAITLKRLLAQKPDAEVYDRDGMKSQEMFETMKKKLGEEPTKN